MREGRVIYAWCVPAKYEQSRGVTSLRRFLRKELIRQVEIEVGDVHAGNLINSAFFRFIEQHGYWFSSCNAQLRCTTSSLSEAGRPG